MELVGDYLRGHTDTIILSLLEKRDSYGYEINQTIEKMTDGDFILTEATLYTAFKRLEKSGYVLSYWMEGENQKRRKYYSITPEGSHYLKNQRDVWQRVRLLLDQMIL